MSVRERVRRERRALAAAAVAAAALWGAGAFAALTALVALRDLAAPLALPVRGALAWTAFVLSLGVAGAALWRNRRVRSPAHIALHIEERSPALRYALVTALEFPESRAAADLERVVEQVNPAGPWSDPRLARALVRPFAAAVVLSWVLAALPRGTLARVLAPRPGDILAIVPPRAARASRLSPIVVRVVPPAYVPAPEATLDDPASVSALAFSRVIVSGRGALIPTEPFGVVGGRSFAATAAGDTWSLSFTMPVSPAVLRLEDRGDRRLLALDPELDQAPVVRLDAPRRDTTYQAPRGDISIAATASDDIGLAHAELEVLHTVGSGERFETRRWIIAPQDLHGAREQSFTATLRLDTLPLGPGDILHIRAVAWDGNDVTGPDTGASDTRTIRLYDPRERDTVSFDAVITLRLDTSAVSQRMLVLRAETLQLRKPRLAADAFRAAAVRLDGQQDQVRELIQGIISDLEEVEGPGVITTAELSLLVRAAGAMADAEQRLRVADVAAALPHMRRALALLTEARARSGRLYLRGGRPKVVVDIPRIRLTGTDSASVGPRTPRPELADPRDRLLVRLDSALALVAQRSPRAADSLTAIRVDALAAARDAALPLGRAIEELRRGGDPTPTLRQARRLLERGVVAEPSPPVWQAMP